MRFYVVEDLPYGPHVVVETSSDAYIVLWSGGGLCEEDRSVWLGALWKKRWLHVVVEARRVSVWVDWRERGWR